MLLLSSCHKKDTMVLSLSGAWTVRLDSLDEGEVFGWYNQNFDQIMQLPGTTDDAGLGVANSLEPKLEKPQLLHLTRKTSYIGAVWYSKKSLSLKMGAQANKLILERVILAKPTYG